MSWLGIRPEQISSPWDDFPVHVRTELLHRVLNVKSSERFHVFFFVCLIHFYVKMLLIFIFVLYMLEFLFYELSYLGACG